MSWSQPPLSRWWAVSARAETLAGVDLVRFVEAGREPVHSDHRVGMLARITPLLAYFDGRWRVPDRRLCKMTYVICALIAIGLLGLGALLTFAFAWRLWGDPD
jgi:hypothetical protein